MAAFDRGDIVAAAAVDLKVFAAAQRRTIDPMCAAIEQGGRTSGKLMTRRSRQIVIPQGIPLKRARCAGHPVPLSHGKKRTELCNSSLKSLIFNQ